MLCFDVAHVSNALFPCCLHFKCFVFMLYMFQMSYIPVAYISNALFPCSMHFKCFVSKLHLFPCCIYLKCFLFRRCTYFKFLFSLTHTPLLHVSTDFPKVLSMPSRLYLPQGLMGRIDCPVESNPPLTVIIWHKDSVAIDYTQLRHMKANKEGTLIIKPVIFTDEGHYTCVPFSPLGRGQPSLPVQVLVRGECQPFSSLLIVSHFQCLLCMSVASVWFENWMGSWVQQMEARSSGWRVSSLKFLVTIHKSFYF